MFELVRRPPLAQAPLPGPPFDCWRDSEGGVALEFRKAEGGFHLRFPDRADFTVDMDNRRVILQPDPAMDPELAVDLFANQVTPLIETYKGALVLHASAVEIDGAAIGFLGATGRGKSTLAAAFARRGFPFLTDDGLRLEASARSYCAHAAHASVRLRPDSRTAILGAERAQPEIAHKVRVGGVADIPHRAAAAPLDVLFALGATDATRLLIAPLGSARAVDALLAHSFMLDTTDKPRMRAHFQRIAALANAVPCLSLDYPRDFAQLTAVVEGIVDFVRARPRQSDA